MNSVEAYAEKLGKYEQALEERRKSLDGLEAAYTAWKGRLLAWEQALHRVDVAMRERERWARLTFFLAMLAVVSAILFVALQ